MSTEKSNWPINLFCKICKHTNKYHTELTDNHNTVQKKSAKLYNCVLTVLTFLVSTISIPYLFALIIFSLLKC